VVRSGWKEQATTVPVEREGLVLEGAWQRGDDRAAVIAPPHPEYGGSLDNPVVNEIAYALHQEGIGSLRFNWRGVGASQGRVTGDLDVGEADYTAALEHVAATLDGPITAAGYSFGAAIALRVALRDARVRRLILVAPPAGMVGSLALDELRRPIHVIVGGRDSIASIESLLELFDLPDVQLDVIPEADHFFATTGLSELSRLVRAQAR
jgi:alpha/beta superfamily hydrolase